MNAPSAAWAVDIASQAAIPALRLETPERTLAASVIEKALADALGIGSARPELIRDARAFFRDWRLDAYCSIAGLDTAAVRERFEAKLRALRRGAVARTRGDGVIVVERVA